jgi:hypothetical protein
MRVAVAMQTVQTLEISDGIRRHMAGGAQIGAVLGFAAGAVYGLSTRISCDWGASGLFSLGTIQCISAIGGRSSWVLIHGMFGGAAVGVIGGAIGWVVRTESWRAVPLGQLRPAVVALPGGRLGIALSVTRRAGP